MAELVDAHDSKSCILGCVGSSPTFGTMKETVFVIAGPTAVGKSQVGVEVAKAVNGEIVSADSRQVYKGLDACSGKVTREEMEGIPHHLLDVTDLEHRYSVKEFSDAAIKAIEEILSQGKVPVIVGGSGMYIHSILYKNTFVEVPPNDLLRKQLENEDLTNLQEKLLFIYPDAIDQVDIQNKRRVIRAIEIVSKQSSIPNLGKKQNFNHKIAILDLEQEKLYERIERRLSMRWKEMIAEAKKLSISKERMQELGLECRAMSSLLEGENERKVYEDLLQKIKKYTIRQKRWNKKYLDGKIFDPEDLKSILDYFGGSTRT